VLAFEGVVILVTSGEVGAVAEIFRLAFIADFVADLSFIGLHIIPGRILQMEYFQVLGFFASFKSV